MHTQRERYLHAEDLLEYHQRLSGQRRGEGWEPSNQLCLWGAHGIFRRAVDPGCRIDILPLRRLSLGRVSLCAWDPLIVLGLCEQATHNEQELATVVFIRPHFSARHGQAEHFRSDGGISDSTINS